MMMVIMMVMMSVCAVFSMKKVLHEDDEIESSPR